MLNFFHRSVMIFGSFWDAKFVEREHYIKKICETTILWETLIYNLSDTSQFHTMPNSFNGTCDILCSFFGGKKNTVKTEM